MQTMLASNYDPKVTPTEFLLGCCLPDQYPMLTFSIMGYMHMMGVQVEWVVCLQSLSQTLRTVDVQHSESRTPRTVDVQHSESQTVRQRQLPTLITPSGNIVNLLKAKVKKIQKTGLISHYLGHL